MHRLGFVFAFPSPFLLYLSRGLEMLELVEWSVGWPLMLPYFDGSASAGFPSPAEDYLETPLDLTDFLIENKAATFLMRVDGDSMKDVGILNGDLLVVDRSAQPTSGSI